GKRAVEVGDLLVVGFRVLGELGEDLLDLGPGRQIRPHGLGDGGQVGAPDGLGSRVLGRVVAFEVLQVHHGADLVVHGKLDVELVVDRLSHGDADHRITGDEGGAHGQSDHRGGGAARAAGGDVHRQ